VAYASVNEGCNSFETRSFLISVVMQAGRGDQSYLSIVDSHGTEAKPPCKELWKRAYRHARLLRGRVSERVRRLKV
jgi:hypothetical protein